MTSTLLSNDFSSLKDKVIVLTGGAQGIGAALVERATQNGAKVVFGDLDDRLGKETAARTGAIFVKTDVVKYADQLALFNEALTRFGRVDHAVANAGVYEPRGLFENVHDLDSIKKEPSTAVIDINVTSVIKFAHIARVYLGQNSQPTDEKSLTLLASVTGLICPADTPCYNASKAAIIGLARSLAQKLPTSHGIRVNAICPSMTETRLVDADVYPRWKELGLPTNSPADVGRAILTLCTSGMNRKILWVEGAKAWDVEEPLMDLVPQWIGDGPWSTLQKITSGRKKF